MKIFSSFLAGLMFGAGLIVSGMTQPAKVIGFLNFFGAWDPTLLFVMVGAVGLYMPGYFIVRGWDGPLFEASFESSPPDRITGRLLIGSALFGLGWGAAGFCPGPAVVSVTSGAWGPALFVVSMLGGMVFYRVVFSDGTSSCG